MIKTKTRLLSDIITLYSTDINELLREVDKRESNGYIEIIRKDGTSLYMPLFKRGWKVDMQMPMGQLETRVSEGKI